MVEANKFKLLTLSQIGALLLAIGVAGTGTAKITCAMVLEIQLPKVADILLKVAADKLGIRITPSLEEVKFIMVTGLAFLVYWIW